MAHHKRSIIFVDWGRVVQSNVHESGVGIRRVDISSIRRPEGETDPMEREERWQINFGGTIHVTD